MVTQVVHARKVGEDIQQQFAWESEYFAPLLVSIELGLSGFERLNPGVALDSNSEKVSYTIGYTQRKESRESRIPPKMTGIQNHGECQWHKPLRS